MNKLPLDTINATLLFLDNKSLAKLSGVNRTMHNYLTDAASWPDSSLKPQQGMTSKDKILSCFKDFLDNLAINQPSRFLMSSQNGNIRFEVRVFCSNGSPILETRDFAPNWPVPHEPGDLPEHDRNCFENSAGDGTYPLQQLPQLIAAWGNSYDIDFFGPRRFINDENFITSFRQALNERIQHLKLNEERRLVQHFQSLSPEEQGQYVPVHFDTIQRRTGEGTRLARGQPPRNRSNRSSCYRTAIKVAVIVTGIGIAIGLHFLGNPFSRWTTRR